MSIDDHLGETPGIETRGGVAHSSLWRAQKRLCLKRYDFWSDRLFFPAICRDLCWNSLCWNSLWNSASKLHLSRPRSSGDREVLPDLPQLHAPPFVPLSFLRDVGVWGGCEVDASGTSITTVRGCRTAWVCATTSTSCGSSSASGERVSHRWWMSCCASAERWRWRSCWSTALSIWSNR